MKSSTWSLLLCAANAVYAFGPGQWKGSDGKCGGSSGLSCWHSMFGNCCSKDGHCGSTPEYCGIGCQSQFGHCSNTKGQELQVSPHGRCGDGIGYTCEGSPLGGCCSIWGFCGSSPEHCGKQCNPKFGKCNQAARRSIPRPLTTSLSTCPTKPMETITSTVWVDEPEETGSSDYPGDGSGDDYGIPDIPSGISDPYAASPAKVIIDPNCVPCEGQPGKNPDEWCGLTIHTNYYKEIPKTCRTVEYTLHIQNTTVKPDGIERLGLIFNGQMPGPMIHASWGDMVRIHVFNDLTNNGTSVHFHGSRMNHTNDMDGVPSITQCPIQPGGKMTYEWRASQYGTSWYHSHFAIQAWEGAFGPLVIKGPHSAKFDIDMGVVTLQDWSHNTVDSMYDAAEDSVAGGPRIMDNGLLNGKNTWGPDGTNNQTGKRFEMDFVPGRKHLIRLVNTAIQSTFKFSIDGHKMTVISTDFTPIEPYEADVININIGQRYNVIVEADQPRGAYWMRSDNQNACAATVQATDIKGIVRYIGAEGAPTSSPYGYTGECVDERSDSIKPILQLDAFASDIDVEKEVTIAPDANNLFRWYLSGETFTSQWNSPTLYQYLENGTHTTTDNLIIELPNEGEWVYLIIEQNVALPHPIHLHGHDFYELASGPGAYTKDIPLRMKNPVRRDTALLPANGYLVIAWVVDNPGVWLAHCHIGWHTSMGMALQFAEMTSNIRSSIKDEKAIRDTCDSWSGYMNKNGLMVGDSGV